MNILIIYLGFFYILLGCLFILIPLLYLELGRPKDLIKAALNLLIGTILIIKNKIFLNSSLAIYFSLSALVLLYLIEIFANRWNQLTDKEKNKLITLVEFKKNLSKLFDAFIIGIKNFQNPLIFFKFNRDNEKIKKKWVRNDKNDNIES